MPAEYTSHSRLISRSSSQTMGAVEKAVADGVESEVVDPSTARSWPASRDRSESREPSLDLPSPVVALAVLAPPPPASKIAAVGEQQQVVGLEGAGLQGGWETSASAAAAAAVGVAEAGGRTGDAKNGALRPAAGRACMHVPRCQA